MHESRPKSKKEMPEWVRESLQYFNNPYFVIACAAVGSSVGFASNYLNPPETARSFIEKHVTPSPTPVPTKRLDSAEGGARV